MTQRTVAVCSAGGAACTAVMTLVPQAACPSWEVVVSERDDPVVAHRAHALVVRAKACARVMAAPRACALS
jgi:hypothetical protein